MYVDEREESAWWSQVTSRRLKLNRRLVSSKTPTPLGHQGSVSILLAHSAFQRTISQSSIMTYRIYTDSGQTRGERSRTQVDVSTHGTDSNVDWN